MLKALDGDGEDLSRRVEHVLMLFLKLGMVFFHGLLPVCFLAVCFVEPVHTREPVHVLILKFEMAYSGNFVDGLFEVSCRHFLSLLFGLKALKS